MRLMFLILMFALRTWIFMFVLDIYVCDDICDICEVYVVSFVWMDGIKKQIKKVYTGHFAECNTRHRCFAECQGHNTRQRTKTWAPV
jgi:hypothetical protein